MLKAADGGIDDAEHAATRIEYTGGQFTLSGRIEIGQMRSFLAATGDTNAFVCECEPLTMTDVFVGRLMSSPVEVVAASTPIRTAATTMLAEEIGSLVVTDDDDRLTGIVTTTDFVHVTADAAAEATVADYMTTDVETVTATDSIQTTADMMVEYGFHHLPVVDDDSRVVGMLTTADLTAYLSHLESTPLA